MLPNDGVEGQGEGAEVIYPQMGTGFSQTIAGTFYRRQQRERRKTSEPKSDFVEGSREKGLEYLTAKKRRARKKKRTVWESPNWAR